MRICPVGRLYKRRLLTALNTTSMFMSSWLWVTTQDEHTFKKEYNHALRSKSSWLFQVFIDNGVAIVADGCLCLGTKRSSSRPSTLPIRANSRHKQVSRPSSIRSNKDCWIWLVLLSETVHKNPKESPNPAVSKCWWWGDHVRVETWCFVLVMLWRS